MPAQQSEFRRRMLALGNGGPVRGPGSSTSDSISARLSDGEFVLPTDTVRKVGIKSLRDLVHMTHEPTGRRPHPARFADGGFVSRREDVGMNAWAQQQEQERNTRRQAGLAHANQAMAEAESAAVSGISTSPPAPSGGLQGVADRLSAVKPAPSDAAQIASDREAFKSAGRGFVDGLGNTARAVADVASLPVRGVVGAYDSAVIRPMRAAGIDAAYLSPKLVPDGVNPSSMTPFMDQKRIAQPASSLAPGQQPLPASVMPSAAGGGRGIVNPSMADPSKPLSSPSASAPGASGYGPIGDRTTLTNEQAGIMNPAGRITVTRGANGTMEFSGNNVGGQVSYNDSSGKALPGGGINGKGFSAFDAAPAGSHVALGPNGSYAYSTSGSQGAASAAPTDARSRLLAIGSTATGQPSQQSTANRSPVGMSVEQAQREGLIGERVGYNPAYDQRLTGSRNQPSAQSAAAADALADRSAMDVRARLLSIGASGPGTGPVAPGSFTGGYSGVIGSTDTKGNMLGRSPEQQRRDAEVSASSIHKPTAARGKAALASLDAQDLQQTRSAGDLAVTQAQQQGLSARERLIQLGANQRAGLDAQRYFDVNQLARRRVALEENEAGYKNRTAQRVESAQLQLENAKTPQEQRSARERLMALMGKSDGDVWAHAPGGQMVDQKTQQLITVPSTIYNRRSGETRAEGGLGAGAAMPSSRDAMVKGQVYQTARGLARWDGSQFQPVR